MAIMIDSTVHGRCSSRRYCNSVRCAMLPLSESINFDSHSNSATLSELSHINGISSALGMIPISYRWNHAYVERASESCEGCFYVHTRSISLSVTLESPLKTCRLLTSHLKADSRPRPTKTP